MSICRRMEDGHSQPTDFTLESTTESLLAHNCGIRLNKSQTRRSLLPQDIVTPALSADKGSNSSTVAIGAPKDGRYDLSIRESNA